MNHSAEYKISMAGISATLRFEASEEALHLLSQVEAHSFDTSQHGDRFQSVARETFEKFYQLQEQFVQSLQISFMKLLKEDVENNMSNFKNGVKK